jgi:hypothetical protein
VYAVVCAVDMELMSPGAAAAGFCVMGLSFMNFMGSGLSAQWKQGKEWYQKYLITTHPHWKQIRLLQVLYTIVTIAVKVSAFITCIYLALYYARLHVQLYGW